jgi:hypothetical protein
MRLRDSAVIAAMSNSNWQARQHPPKEKGIKIFTWAKAAKRL